MKSEYVRESTSNDLETFGHIKTTCQTVMEFIQDIVRNNGHYQFIFQKNTKVFGVDLKECVAELVFKDGNILHDTGVSAIKNERIGNIKYCDGWGGVEIWVTLEGGSNG